jgi:ubiquinone/menaquinone biosynthesis C-methylase UbiE
MDIADYDSTHYNYEQYWQGRDYEDAAERIALLKLLPTKIKTFLDIGGGYGRLLPVILPKSGSTTLLDYSQENLNRAEELFGNKITLVKGNVYELPFPDNSFDCGMMIRVMHHLEEPQKSLQEIYRVMAPGSTFILEYANKCHVKALFSHGPLFCWNTNPANKLTKESGVFLNFHPRFMKNLVKDTGWVVSGKLSVSNFRSPILKRLFPATILCKIESILQKPLAAVSFGPSIFYKLTKPS